MHFQFLDHPGELVLEENFWTSWCKGRLTNFSNSLRELKFEKFTDISQALLVLYNQAYLKTVTL